MKHLSILPGLILAALTLVAADKPSHADKPAHFSKPVHTKARPFHASGDGVVAGASTGYGAKPRISATARYLWTLIWTFLLTLSSNRVERPSLRPMGISSTSILTRTITSSTRGRALSARR